MSLRPYALCTLLACGQPPSTAADGAVADGVAPLAPHPFGTHGGYTATGVISPSHRTQAQLDGATAQHYDAWKAAYLVPGCAVGQYRIKTSPATTAFSVSEGHGYGMLVAATMDGYDPRAHEIFDGMYAYYDAHRSHNNAGLMAWAQDQACTNVDGADSASDGDLDIAYALLLANRQWGSAGAVNYGAAAAQIIAAINAADLHPASSILVGDWAGAGDPHYTGTRPSDFMTGHFRVFGGRGADVVEHTYALVGYLQDHASPATGLLPDFVVNATGMTPAPAPANWLEGADDGNYAYNACRVPWRLATDYLMTGEPRARVAVQRIEAWIRAKTSGQPAKIRDGYKLDGTATGASAELAFVAPFAVGAMIEPVSGTNQPWLNALWDAIVARPIGEYYGDSVKLLSMIVISGNWWAP